MPKLAHKKATGVWDLVDQQFAPDAGLSRDVKEVLGTSGEDVAALQVVGRHLDAVTAMRSKFCLM